MRSANRRLLFAILVMPALALAACGGGGGTSLVAIDQANAADVASAALGAAEFVSAMADVVDGLIDILEVGVSGTVPCPGGGTATVTIDDAAPLGEISAGDSVSLRFNDCVLDFEGDPFTYNGALAFDITGASFPGPDAYDILLRATFGNLVLSSMGTTFTVNGGLDLRRTTPDNVVFTSVASGSSLEVTIQDGAVVARNSVKSFRYEEMSDDGTGDYSISGFGRVYDGGLGASFDSEVLIPLTGTAPDDPDSGQFEATGAGNSSVLLVALDDVNVELRVDEDGDGIVDVVIPSTWSAIRG